MTTTAALPESNMLRKLRQVSEARGLTFYVNPPPDIVPDFLGNLRPDAIARGPDGGIIIGVKRRGTPDADQRLVDIAERVSAQKGWEFRAIYLVPPVDDAPAIAKPTEQQLDAAFEQIEALTNGGHHGAALLMAWAALESLARLVNESEDFWNIEDVLATSGGANIGRARVSRKCGRRNPPPPGEAAQRRCAWRPLD